MDCRIGVREALLKKANYVASVAELNYVLHNIQQCNSYFYCNLFKVLSGSDIVFHKHYSEEEKCQILLQALQQFLAPHVKLDHIQYSRLAEQNEFDVKNLLDIFVILFQNNQKAAELSTAPKRFCTPTRDHSSDSPLHQSTPHAMAYSSIFSKPQLFSDHQAESSSSSSSTTKPLLLKTLLNRYLKDVALTDSPQHLTSGGGPHCPPVSKPDILQQCEQLFPAIYCEPSTIKRLNVKTQQMEQFNAQIKPLPSTLKRIDNLQQRLELMMKVVQKDLINVKCLHDSRDRRFFQRSIQKALHSKRLSDAKVQRYFRDYELQQKKKLQKPRTEEEQVLVKAVEKGLKARKEERRYTHKCAQEKLQLVISKHLEKIEKRFKDSSSLPTSRTGEHRVPDSLNLDMDLQKMEKDIQQLQLETHRDKEAVYFRELDATRIKWRF